jgi:hypothetical protein
MCVKDRSGKVKTDCANCTCPRLSLYDPSGHTPGNPDPNGWISWAECEATIEARISLLLKAPVQPSAAGLGGARLVVYEATGR